MNILPYYNEYYLNDIKTKEKIELLKLFGWMYHGNYDLFPAMELDPLSKLVRYYTRNIDDLPKMVVIFNFIKNTYHLLSVVNI